MELLRLLQVLWRRKGVVALSTALFVLVALLATALLPEQYTASTQVIVEGDDSTTSLLNELGLSEMAMSLTSADDDIQNKIYLATSAPVIEEVVWRLQLRDRGGELYAWDDVADAGLLAPIVGTPSITVTQTQGTDVLVIEATGPSPEAARLMADTLAEVYIAQQTRGARAEFTEAQAFIEERLAVVTAELDQVYGQVALVQRETDVIDLDAEQRAAVARLSELTMERELVFGRIQETRARIKTQRAQRALESVDGGVSAASMTQNPLLGKLRTQLSELHTTRQSLLLNHHTELAPEVVEIDGRIEAVQTELARALADQQALDPQVAELEAELAGLLERQRAITEAIDRTQAAGSTYPDLRRRFSQLQLQAAAAEDVYRSLQDQSFQIAIAEKMTMSDLRITARAELPEDAASPKPVLNLALGLLLGLMFGCASALLLELVDDTVRTPEEVRATWDLAQLGLLPRYRAADRPALAELPATDPLVEAHRALRNGIDFASLDKPIRLLGITSTIPGEGKSTLAVNLAISMAREGRRVLLIDGDLRMPTQHRRFQELRAAPGLVEVLSRSLGPQEAVQTSPIENLDVLVAGALPPNPGHLVESLRMRQVLLEIARAYDIVILDTPPVLAVNDPVVLARLVDGMIVVVESGRTTRRMLAEARQRFEAARVAPLGFVLNKVRASSTSYAKYGRYYQAPPAPPAASPPSAPRKEGAA